MTAVILVHQARNHSTKYKRKMNLKFKSSFVVPLLFSFTCLLFVNAIFDKNEFLWAILVPARILLKTVLSDWNWLQWHESKCLIPNMFHKELHQDENESQCWPCETIKKFKPIKKHLNKEEVFEYLMRRQPVVENSIEEAVDYNQLVSCFINGTIKFRPVDTMSSLMQPLINRAFKLNFPWIIQKKLMQRDEKQAFRKIIKKPAFVPNSFDCTGSHWIMTSKSYTPKAFKALSSESPWIWLTQIKGQSRLRLFSKCRGLCNDIDIVVNESSSILVSQRFWDLTYMTSNQSFCLAVAGECFF
uniref:Uncharacterized protein n=1 Tax=Romanomermis culicivorax TaxID=13658 RepID=A0A915K2D9_ROMCU